MQSKFFTLQARDINTFLYGQEIWKKEFANKLHGKYLAYRIGVTSGPLAFTFVR